MNAYRELGEAVKLLKNLVGKLEIVHKDEQYRSSFVDYSGPNYEVEFKAAEAWLKMRETNNESHH